MEILVKKGDLTESKCNVLVVGMFLNEKKSVGVLSDVDAKLGGLLAKHMKQDKFKAKPGAIYLSRTFGRMSAVRVLVVGLGKRDEFNLEVARNSAASVLNSVKSLKVKRVVIEPFGLAQGLDGHDLAQALTEGLLLADYEFAQYKKAEGKAPNEIVVMTSDGRLARSFAHGIDDGKLTSQATAFARDLVNTPGQDMHPEVLVEKAKQIAKGASSVKIKVFDKEKLERMGAGGILGVGQGSEKPVFLVHMVYKPSKPTKKKICLVGKAVTFDSGGLSLKPADFMTTMKIDMAGAADVLGVFSVIAKLAPKMEVHGIFAPVENMPSGSAIRPGDVVRMMNKKTVEVLNTDAEGRLTLGDMLVYACKQKPDAVIDLATLTGACVVALGEEISGVMSNNDSLSEKVLASAKVAGEKMWPLPLEQSYKQLMKSDIADMKNLGNRWGGVLVAGLFLEEFVKKDVPWVHIDIAGPAYAERPINAYEKKGGTGHGVRTLINLLKTF